MRRRKPMIIGYGRTSTTDQTASLAGHERDLAAAGATKLFQQFSFCLTEGFFGFS